jgi:hypothetical protein
VRRSSWINEGVNYQCEGDSFSECSVINEGKANLRYTPVQF